jgi:lipid A 3-O-deacylase
MTHIRSPHSRLASALWLFGAALTLGMLHAQAACFGCGTNCCLHGGVFNIVEENDLFLDTDRHYTQGLKLSYLHREQEASGWTGRVLDALTLPGLEGKADRWGFAIGQNIYTPGDIRSTALLLNDRPYGGWLYAGLILQRRGTTAGGALHVWDHFELDLGMIGPESLAGDAQNWVHQVRGIPEALGWHNQLKSEPALQLKGVRHWVWRLPQPKNDPESGWAVDLIPHTGLELGNVSTSARLGGGLRLGWNVPLDFGPQRVDSLAVSAGDAQEEWAWHGLGAYVFADAEGRVVGYSTLLDGNLFHNSHHVSKRLFVAEMSGGAAVVFKRVEFIASVTLRTKEFEGQSERNAFGSLSVRFKF